MNRITCCLLLIGLSVLIQGGAASAAFDRDKDPNLIGYWNLNDGSGTIAHDSSGKGHDGTLVNMVAATATLPALLPAWTDGFMGGALAFNPATSTQGQMVNCGTSPDFDLTSQVTVAAWIYDSRPTATADEEFVCKGDTAYSLKERGSAGDVEFFIQNAGTWNSATFTGCLTASSANTWIHLAGTYDGANIKLYKNGVLGPTTAYTGPIALNTMPISIAAEWQSATTSRRQLMGRVDEVRVYSRALAAAEVAALLINPQASNPTPANKATDQNRDGLILSWTPGNGAVKQNVYLGTNTNALALVSASQDASTFACGRLQLGATYFWRIDGVSATGTVVAGSTWQFTVEPDTYQLASSSITATASAFVVGSEPTKTIDGSGLTGDLAGTEPNTMWAAAGTPQPVWIQYNFDRVYKMSQMLVWNYNAEFEMFLGIGLKNVTVQVSTDGVNFTKLGDFVFAQADSAAGYKYNTTVNFNGVAAKAVKIVANSNYGGQQYGLSEVRFLYTRAAATVPSPITAATGIAPNVTLSWRTGRDVATHNVFLGTDPNVLTLSGTSITPSFAPAGLSLSTKYYWRVDEVNGAGTWSSDVWNFTTADYVVVDDMESYNDTTKKVFETWVDGYSTPTTNGAIVGYSPSANGTFNNTTTVHGGTQSMPLAYTNTATVSSEAKCTFGTAQDWSLYGIKTLTLYFYGDPANAAAQLYVTINSTKVLYNGAAGNLQRARWNQWNVDLSAIAAATLKSVKTLTIGLSGAGTGKLLIDDIVLYKSAPAIPVAVNPGTTGLMAYYAFSNNVNDGSGNGNNGTLVGAPTYVAGLAAFGTAMKFNGTTDAVNLGASKAAFNPTGSLSISLWANIGTWSTAWGHVMISNRGESSLGWQLRRYSNNMFCFTTRGTAGQDDMQTNAAPALNQWIQITCVFDNVANTKTIYMNGIQDRQLATTAGGKLAATTFNAYIGCRDAGTNAPDTTSFFSGMLDEIRVFNRALTAGEAEFLSNPTP